MYIFYVWGTSRTPITFDNNFVVISITSFVLILSFIYRLLIYSCIFLRVLLRAFFIFFVILFLIFLNGCSLNALFNLLFTIYILYSPFICSIKKALNHFRSLSICFEFTQLEQMEARYHLRHHRIHHLCQKKSLLQ